MITVQNLYHSYSKDDKYAVKDASFEIPKGEVFGFLGPSGCGQVHGLRVCLRGFCVSSRATYALRAMT